MLRKIVASPFGLQMGMSLHHIGGSPEQVENDEYGKPQYRVVDVPKPHSAFGSYLLLVDSKMGLALIQATGKNIVTTQERDLMSAYFVMKAKLGLLYGKHNTNDQSIHDEPNRSKWMTKLVENKQPIHASWSAEAGSSLSIDLMEVELQPVATNDNEGHLQLCYLFTNLDLVNEDWGADVDVTLSDEDLAL